MLPLQEWNETMIKEQEAMPKHEQPKLLVADIGRKMAELDREVKYLLNKMKTFKPKPKSKPDEKKSPNETKTEEKTTEEKGKRWLVNNIYFYLYWHWN